MSTPKQTYEKFIIGDQISSEDLEKGFTHFSTLATLLYASGPVFQLAAIEANRVASQFCLFLDNRKAEAQNEDRNSKPYQEGYATGIVWTYDYVPGGPFHHAPSRSDPQHIRLANESLERHRRWMMGFQEGLSAKKAGHKPSGDLLKCDPEPIHQHNIHCLRSHIWS